MRLTRHPIPELTYSLKQLRLSGILDSLEARNRDAIDGPRPAPRKLAFTDFLSLLIHDEVARRENKKLDLRLRRANFRSQKTPQGFDFDRLPNLNRAAIHDLATCRFIDEKVAVLIAGPCGTGKSHLAQSVGTCGSTTRTRCLVHPPIATTRQFAQCDRRGQL